MILLQIPVGHMDNFTYVIGDSGEALIIDPSWDLDKVLDETSKNGLKVVAMANTHHHFDHTKGNKELADRTGAKIYAHRSSALPKDVALDDGGEIPVGKIKVKVLHTPGHTPDSVCFLVQKNLFTGDTLFVDECGRVDLPGGSSEDLYHTFFDKLLKLDDNVVVYPGHDYGEKPYSTIGEQRKSNYTLKPRSREEFIRFMAEP
ncbi:MAG: MBL fold metallo-hydrolase [Thaumarchaeota archaeon]|nr:MBL fold metallo-hydrolase [Nitrososphaerota archaeon]